MPDNLNDLQSVAAADLPHLKERAQFRSLILTNPNYFGNLANSPLQSVLNIAGNTTYEEIGCVGFEPQLSLLEAVVYIKQITGYGGGICGVGSQEYVRFYLSFDDGATWQDQGEVYFTVYDVAAAARGNQRLEYACSLKINPPKKFCSQRNIIRARAILSWNTPNPPNAPNHIPVWGNVHNTFIQVAKLSLFLLGDIFTLANVKLPQVLEEVVDPKTEISAKAAKTLSAFELQDLYKDQKVEPHRLALKEALAVLEQPQLTQNLMTAGYKFPFAGFSSEQLFGPIAAAIASGQGNTSYEQLECIGYYPGDNEALIGTVRVKLPSGYSGGPCTAGSFEYVTFWADLDGSGSFATCLGQTSVNVHDFNPIPEGGLEYAVFLPVDLGQYRQLCQNGPKLIPIRAILSWNAAPPCNNPNYVPVWGNRLETLILVRPGAPSHAMTPLLSRAGDVSYIDINSSGLANGSTLETGLVCHDSPFGGLINLAGKIPSGTAGTKYRIMKKRHSDSDTFYAPIVNEPQGIGLFINSWDSMTGWTTSHVVKHAEAPIADGYYTYEDYSSTHYVEANLMGYWQTVAADDGGLFDLRIDVSVDGNPAHDLRSNVVTVLIDNTPPVALLNLDLGGGQCGDFTPGSIINGHFTATDIHFGSFSFEIEPSGPPNFPSHGHLPNPPSGDSVLFAGSISDPGLFGASWSLNTGAIAGPPALPAMDPCGYALILHVSDRTNVNNGFARNTAQASIGFCLRRPQ
ncbi:MAG: hypothetical protein JO182_24195 [Acidobacteriaceae bacterium]|nr:hypothetical protein [Acidobacteriaceae bacterium]MBV9305297.1 hypothetical protein [Acidobacteriaceae bacterium]